MEMISSATPQPQAGRRRRILVVDDNAMILKVLSLKLKANGYDVSTATDGSEAISIVRKEKPDLILVDVSFPPDVGHGGGVPWDGFLIMDWVRRIDEAKHIPFVVITGGDPVKYEKRSLDAGAVAFFHKPIDHEGLISVIRRTLGESNEPPTPGFDTTTFEI
jgi:CheY-like chemotaxis protein